DVSAPEPLPQPVAAAVRMTLGGTDRHPGGRRYLFERVAQRVLEYDHPRLFGRDIGERVTQLPSQLGDPHAARRIVFGVGAQLVRQCVVRSRALPFGHVATRVDDEPVEPGRELRLATELAQAD